MFLHARVFCAVGLVTALLLGSSARPAAADDSGQAFKLDVRAGSAVGAFREAVSALRGDRLKGLTVRSAISDRHDHFVEAFFTANFGVTPVVGLLFAGSDGFAGGIINTPGRFRQSLPSLVQRLQALLPAQSGGARGYGVQPLRQVSFDGGSIALPAGWSVMGSSQGCVEAGSPQDHSYMGLGCQSPGVVPPGLPGTDPQMFLIAPYSNPPQILGAYMRNKFGAEGFRVIEAKQIESRLPYGQAGIILFDYQIRGIPFRGLAMVNIAPSDQMSYLIFKSMFLTPADSFARLAPTLWRSWQSWGVNSGVLTGRMVDAAQSMRATGSLISSSSGSSQRGGSSDGSAGFDEYIRGTATVQNITTGERGEGSYLDARAIVDHDPTKFVILPSSNYK